jgi:hypothetical protein
MAETLMRSQNHIQGRRRSLRERNVFLRECSDPPKSDD